MMSMRKSNNEKLHGLRLVLFAEPELCYEACWSELAADPLFTVSYTGVNAGLVIVVADDPHSSQNSKRIQLGILDTHGTRDSHN